MADRFDMPHMIVDDVVYAVGRGLILTGKATAEPRLGQMTITLPNTLTYIVECSGIERHCVPVKPWYSQPVGLLFQGIRKEDIPIGSRVTW